MRMKYWLISIIWLLVVSNLAAQHYPYTIVTLKDGLPQSSVYKTIQDKQGYIWMATEAGLCRYDGYEFRNYSYHSGLDANFIFDIEFDPLGRLWIGSFGSGIAVYNGFDFYSFNISNGFPANFITDMLFSKAGELWIASKDSYVIRISMDYRPKIHIYNEIGENFQANKIAELPNGDIVAAGRTGIIQFSGDSSHQYKLRRTNNQMFSVFVDSKGTLWAGGYESLLCFRKGFIEDKSNGLKKGTVVNNISMPGDDGILYLSTDDGLLKIDGEQRTWINTRNGLSYDLTKDVTRDNFGNTWVSTYGNGATILNDRGITHYDSDGSGGDVCSFSLAEDFSGTMWIGKYNGGFFECTDSSFKKSNLPLGPNANSSTSYSDKNGNVYLLADGKIIYKITNHTIEWKFVFPSETILVFGLLKLDNNQLLVCTTEGGYYLDDKTNVLTKIKSTGNKFLKEPFYDEFGNVWMVGESGEVYKLSDDKLTEYTKLVNPKGAAISDAIYDSWHHLWVFSSAKGLLFWNGENTLVLHSGNGLRSDLIFSVTQDLDGRIWIGHVLGLECIDIDTKKIFHIGYDQGFLPIETNSGAAITDRKGNVWFGTLTSATKIDVKEIGKDNTKGILRLREIDVNGKTHFMETYNDSVNPKLHLSYSENNISFQIVSLCYTNAKDVLYSYKMEGIDKDWITKINTKEISYTNLLPGDYIFKAKAKNPNGFVTNQIDIKIHIANPIWKTAGFYLLEIVIFLFLVFLSFRFSRQSSNNRLGQIMTLLTIFIVFESAMLYISGYIDRFTNGIPVFQLVMNVILAASLYPLENRIKRLMRKLARNKT